MNSSYPNIKQTVFSKEIASLSQRNTFNYIPCTIFLDSCNYIHSITSPLWITKSGHVLTQSFLINCLHLFFNNTISGQSMRAGGATALAEHGVPPHIIQACGRWASNAFLIYIMKNPTLLQGFLFAHLHHPPHNWSITSHSSTCVFFLSPLFSSPCSV